MVFYTWAGILSRKSSEKKNITRESLILKIAL